MFKDMGVKTFHIGKSLDDHQRTTVIFKDQKCFIRYFMNLKKKTRVKL